MKYLVLSSPRTGSTMLAAALNATGKAGTVKEYFHRNELAKHGNPEQTKEGMLAHYAGVIDATTSANGVFGMKLHFNQFNDVFGGKRIGMGNGLSFVKGFDRRILVYRRDKILQALSELLATKTQVWNTAERSAERRAGTEFSDAEIPVLVRIMSRQISEEYAWRSLLEDSSLGFHQIAYEDLVADPDAELARLAAYLAIPGLETLKAARDTVKLTDEAATAAIRQRVLTALGVGPVSS